MHHRMSGARKRLFPSYLPYCHSFSLPPFPDHLYPDHPPVSCFTIIPIRLCLTFFLLFPLARTGLVRILINRSVTFYWLSWQIYLKENGGNGRKEEKGVICSVGIVFDPQIKPQVRTKERHGSLCPLCSLCSAHNVKQSFSSFASPTYSLGSDSSDIDAHPQPRVQCTNTYAGCAASAGSRQLHISKPRNWNGWRTWVQQFALYWISPSDRHSPLPSYPSPPIYPFSSISLVLFRFSLSPCTSYPSPSSFLPSYSYLILRRPRACVIMRVMPLPRYSIAVAANCIVSARFLLFRSQLRHLAHRAASACPADQRGPNADSIDRSIDRIHPFPNPLSTVPYQNSFAEISLYFYPSITARQQTQLYSLCTLDPRPSNPSTVLSPDFPDNV